MALTNIDDIIRYKLSETIHISPQDLAQAREEVGRAIMEFCHISAIPEGLLYTWANMTVDLIRYQYYSRNPQAVAQTVTEAVEGSAGPIETLRMGDVSLTFGSDTSATTDTQGLIAMNAHAPGLDELVMAYYDQLRNYRRLKR
jgi:hypothetical protein